MGRHSRGAGEAPAPLPDPPTRHPYAPRSVEDTGIGDHRTYRVVDVGPPPAAPGAPSPAEPGGFRSSPPRRGHGATRADLAAAPAPTQHPAPEPRRPGDPHGQPAPAPPAPGGSRLRGPDPTGPRFGAPDPTGSRFGAPDPTGPRLGGARADHGERGFGGARADLAEPRFRAPTESRSGAERADGGEPRFGATRADLESRPGESRFRTPAADTGESGFRAPAGESRFGGPATDTGESRRGGPAADPGGSRRGGPAAAPGGSRFGAGRADSGGSRFGGGESRSPAEHGLPPVWSDLADSRFGATRADLAEPRPGRREEPAGSRSGATRADLAESVGSTALAPRPAPDPDEVTDTGARRARSAFRLATETSRTDDAGEPDEHADKHADEDEHDYEREPALILQWGIFLAQTLTGAVAGLGIWLGFYRLWSTWPFYAVPAVGVVAIGMLVLARALRRRHGHDLDLLTAAVTAGIITVLTVLPAAFTLQGLTQ